jgi:hypothetical protein
MFDFDCFSMIDTNAGASTTTTTSRASGATGTPASTGGWCGTCTSRWAAAASRRPTSGPYSASWLSGTTWTCACWCGRGSAACSRVRRSSLNGSRTAQPCARGRIAGSSATRALSPLPSTSSCSWCVSHRNHVNPDSHHMSATSCAELTDWCHHSQGAQKRDGRKRIFTSAFGNPHPVRAALLSARQVKGVGFV